MVEVWTHWRTSKAFKVSSTRSCTTAASSPDAAQRKENYSKINDLLLDESFIMVLAGVPIQPPRSTLHGVDF